MKKILYSILFLFCTFFVGLQGAASQRSKGNSTKESFIMSEAQNQANSLKSAIDSGDVEKIKKSLKSFKDIPLKDEVIKKVLNTKKIVVSDGERSQSYDPLAYLQQINKTNMLAGFDPVWSFFNDQQIGKALKIAIDNDDAQIINSMLKGMNQDLKEGLLTKKSLTFIKSSSTFDSFDGNTPLGYAKEEKKPNAIGALTTVMKELGIKTDGVFSSGEASSASSKPQLEKQPSFIGSIKEGVSSLFSSFSSSDGSKTVSATSSPSSSSSSSASSSSSSSASSAAKSTPASFQLQKRDFVNYIDLVLKDEDSPTNYANANVLLAEKTDEQKNEMASQQTFSEDPSLIDCSLLQAAVIKNNKVLVNWLLKNGANVNFTNSVSKNLNAQKKAITLVQANNTGNLIKKELIQAGAEDPDAPATPSPSVNPSSGPFVRAEGSVDSSSSSFADKVGKFGGVSTAATASARAPKKENGSRLKIERRKSVGSARGMPEETPSVSKPPVQPPQTSLAKAKEEAAENQLMSRAFDALHQSFRYQRPLTQDNFGQAIKEMQEKCQPYLSRGEE